MVRRETCDIYLISCNLHEISKTIGFFKCHISHVQLKIGDLNGRGASPSPVLSFLLCFILFCCIICNFVWNVATISILIVPLMVWWLLFTLQLQLPFPLFLFIYNFLKNQLRGKNIRMEMIETPDGVGIIFSNMMCSMASLPFFSSQKRETLCVWSGLMDEGESIYCLK